MLRTEDRSDDVLPNPRLERPVRPDQVAPRARDDCALAALVEGRRSAAQARR